MVHVLNNIGLALVVIFAAFLGASIFFRSELKHFGVYRHAVVGMLVSFIVLCAFSSLVGVHVPA